MNGYKIIDFNDVQAELEALHKYGWDSGHYVGFPSFEKHYNMVAGGVTDWTGYPSSGKSELCLELLFNMSSFYGWVHMLFVPDIGKTIEVMAKLIHKYTGKTFIRKYPNFIELKTAFNSCAWLLDHFKIIKKIDIKARVTPIEIWNFAAEFKKQERLDSILIDSWKDVFHDYKEHGGSYAQYLSNVLPIRNEIADQSKLHIHTIIHPKNPVVNAKDRKVYPPSTYDMEGGAQWANSGRCIISVHRESFDDNVTDVYFRKIKPESIGRNTNTPICLQFDATLSRYYHLDENAQKIYAEQKHKRPSNEPQKLNYEF